MLSCFLRSPSLLAIPILVNLFSTGRETFTSHLQVSGNTHNFVHTSLLISLGEHNAPLSNLTLQRKLQENFLPNLAVGAAAFGGALPLAGSS
jgi:hypothetical protein